LIEMKTPIGVVAALYRYPVKSMAGEPIDAAELGWHGVVGDRRLAFRRVGDRTGFPWLTASKLPELVLHRPVRSGHPAAAEGALPSHVRIPDGTEWPLFSPELADELGRRHGSPVEMLHLDRGIFDEAGLSIIAEATVGAIAGHLGRPADARRYRPNLLIETRDAVPFGEEAWLGGVLTFGPSDDGPVVTVTNHDLRCSMVNIDPDTARLEPEWLKAVAGLRNGNAGMYGTVTRRGRIEVGQTVHLETPLNGALEVVPVGLEPGLG
jgi:hypothetical protein